MLDKVSRQITNRINELEDSLKQRKAMVDFNIPSPGKTLSQIPGESMIDSSMLMNFIQDQNIHNNQIKSEIDALKCNLSDIKTLLSNTNNSSSSNNNNNNSTTSKTYSMGDLIGMNRSQTLPRNQNFYSKAEQKPFVASTNSIPNNPNLVSNMNGGRQKASDLSLDEGQMSPLEMYGDTGQQVQQGIQDMQYLQQRLEEFQTDSRDGSPGKKVEPLYPTIPDQNTISKSGRSTPRRRRRKKKNPPDGKGYQTDTEHLLMTSQGEYDVIGGNDSESLLDQSV